MESKLLNLTYEIDLQPGEPFALPESLTQALGPGRWRITIQPLSPAAPVVPIRSHDAFMNSYAPEDEGLYDEYPAR
jgi:hypothetical protein